MRARCPQIIRHGMTRININDVLEDNNNQDRSTLVGSIVPKEYHLSITEMVDSTMDGNPKASLEIFDYCYLDPKATT